MSDIDVAALRAAAEGATPGQWQTVYGEVVWIDETMIARADTQSDGRYIATASPAVVLQLLDRLAAAEGAVARVRGVAGSHDFAESVVRKTCAVGPSDDPHHTCRLAGEAAAAAVAILVDVGLQGPQIETEEQS